MRAIADGVEASRYNESVLNKPIAIAPGVELLLPAAPRARGCLIRLRVVAVSYPISYPSEPRARGSIDHMTIRAVVLAIAVGVGCSGGVSTPPITAGNLHDFGPCDEASWGSDPFEQPLPADCELACAEKTSGMGSECMGTAVDHSTGSAEQVVCTGTFVVAGVQGCCGPLGIADGGQASFPILFAVCGGSGA